MAKMPTPPKRTAARPAAVKSCNVPESQYASVNVRKISNGYLISQSHEGKGGYKHTETFSPTKPKITMPVVSAAKGKKL